MSRVDHHHRHHSSPRPRTSRLRAARLARGLTGEELAALAGVSLKTVYSAEAAGARPQRATRRVLAIALGCTVDEIFPLTEARETSSVPGPSPSGPGIVGSQRAPAAADKAADPGPLSAPAGQGPRPITSGAERATAA